MKHDLVMIGCKGLMAADARESAIKQALDEKCTHAFFLDADHLVPEETLDCLMENADEAMTSGLICRRGDPFDQVSFGKTKSGGYAKIEIPLDGRLYQVGVCAFGCTIINLKKLQKLEKPWFRDTCEPKSDGIARNIRSDINLCDAFRANGEDVWIDSRILVGHMGQPLICYPQNAGHLRCFKPVYEAMFQLRENQKGFHYKPSGRVL